MALQCRLKWGRVPEDAEVLHRHLGLGEEELMSCLPFTLYGCQTSYLPLIRWAGGFEPKSDLKVKLLRPQIRTGKFLVNLGSSCFWKKKNIYKNISLLPSCKQTILSQIWMDAKTSLRNWHTWFQCCLKCIRPFQKKIIVRAKLFPSCHPRTFLSLVTEVPQNVNFKGIASGGEGGHVPIVTGADPCSVSSSKTKESLINTITTARWLPQAIQVWLQ